MEEEGDCRKEGCGQGEDDVPRSCLPIPPSKTRKAETVAKANKSKTTRMAARYEQNARRSLLEAARAENKADRFTSFSSGRCSRMLHLASCWHPAHSAALSPPAWPSSCSPCLLGVPPERVPLLEPRQHRGSPLAGICGMMGSSPKSIGDPSPFPQLPAG